MSLRKHTDLDVWRDSIELVAEIYTLTTTFPHEELYGRSAQMRRASASVVSNIAEGAARGSRADFARFDGISRGSLAELDAQLAIACRLGFCDAEAVPGELLNRTFARLNSLHRALKDTDAQ